MAKFVMTLSKSALTGYLVFGVMSAAAYAGDLSRYRGFQLGSDLPTIAKQAGVNPSQATTIHSRPALIQELTWRPQLLSSPKSEPQEVVFSFYENELFQIAVQYDRYETEGLTADDVVDAISAIYGASAKRSAPAAAAPGPYGEREELVAEWQDSQYRFDLIRSSYGPTFRLIGVLKGLESQVQSATLEAKRLEALEAPQREAARIESEQGAAKAKLEKARLLNRPNFRP